MDPDRLVTYEELKDIFGIPYSRMHLLRLEKQGLFPKRIALHISKKVWRAGDLIAWRKKVLAGEWKNTFSAKKLTQVAG